MTMRKAKQKNRVLPPPEATGQEVMEKYIPTQKEREVVGDFLAARKEKIPAPGIKVKNINGVADISLDHPEIIVGQTVLMKALATTDTDFYKGLISQLVGAGTQGRLADEKGINFMLSVIKGVEPKDQLETMLAAQMAAVHMATMTFARRLTHVDTITQQDSAERAFNKLARTFTTQMEALARYRGKGQQKMTVEHVHVHEGGQAIVGNVNQGPREGEG